MCYFAFFLLGRSAVTVVFCRLQNRNCRYLRLMTLCSVKFPKSSTDFTFQTTKARSADSFMTRRSFTSGLARKLRGTLWRLSRPLVGLWSSRSKLILWQETIKFFSSIAWLSCATGTSQRSCGQVARLLVAELGVCVIDISHLSVHILWLQDPYFQRYWFC